MLRNPTGDPLGLLDDPVVPLGAGVGYAEFEEHGDGGPPGLYGGGEPFDLGDLDAGAGVIEPPAPVAYPVRVAFGEQLPQKFLGPRRRRSLWVTLNLFCFKEQPGAISVKRADSAPLRAAWAAR